MLLIALLSILYSTEALPLSDAIIKQRIEAKVSDTPELVTRVRVLMSAEDSSSEPQHDASQYHC
jgi:hypothetical protein